MKPIGIVSIVPSACGLKRTTYVRTHCVDDPDENNIYEPSDFGVGGGGGGHVYESKVQTIIFRFAHF